jgi:hypothetical protein
MAAVSMACLLAIELPAFAQAAPAGPPAATPAPGGVLPIQHLCRDLGLEISGVILDPAGTATVHGLGSSDAPLNRLLLLLRHDNAYRYWPVTRGAFAADDWKGWVWQGRFTPRDEASILVLAVVAGAEGRRLIGFHDMMQRITGDQPGIRSLPSDIVLCDRFVLAPRTNPQPTPGALGR